MGDTYVQVGGVRKGPIIDVYMKKAGVWQVQQEIIEQVGGVPKNVYIAEKLVTLSANQVNLDLSTLFASADWTRNVKKRVLIPAGIIVGSSNASIAALISGTGFGGTLTVDLLGEIQGAGGVANSGIGGDAVNVQASNFIIKNAGAIRAGGGGAGVGGTGGTGGTGYYVATQVGGGNYGGNNSGYTLTWAGNVVPGSGMPRSVGGYNYYVDGPDTDNTGGTQGPNNMYLVSRTYNVYVGGAGGGAGGAGGRGQGYGQANAGGNPGAGGGNAGGNSGVGGTGGTGGTGGVWGTAGATGNTGAAGASGNYTAGGSGYGGGAGGAAGRAINGVARTVINTGTIQGAV